MIEFLLGILIFISGFIIGIEIPLIFHKYFHLMNMQIKDIENKEELKKVEPSKNEFSNLTSDLISEWQTGKALGDDDNE